VGRLPGVNPEADRPACQIAHHPELCANRGGAIGDTLPKLPRVSSLRIGSDWLPGLGNGAQSTTSSAMATPMKPPITADPVASARLGSTRRVAIPAER